MLQLCASSATLSSFHTLLPTFGHGSGGSKTPPNLSEEDAEGRGQPRTRFNEVTAGAAPAPLPAACRGPGGAEAAAPGRPRRAQRRLPGRAGGSRRPRGGLAPRGARPRLRLRPGPGPGPAPQRRGGRRLLAARPGSRSALLRSARLRSPPGRLSLPGGKCGREGPGGERGGRGCSSPLCSVPHSPLRCEGQTGTRACAEVKPRQPCEANRGRAGRAGPPSRVVRPGVPPAMGLGSPGSAWEPPRAAGRCGLALVAALTGAPAQRATRRTKALFLNRRPGVFLT